MLLGEIYIGENVLMTMSYKRSLLVRRSFDRYQGLAVDHTVLQCAWANFVSDPDRLGWQRGGTGG